LNPAAAPASAQFAGDLWKQVFGPKKQDRDEESCYPVASDSGFDQMGSRGEAARHDTSRAVLNFIGLIRGLFVRFAGAARRQTTRRCDHVLLSMQVGEIWREQIVWPNGSVHHFC
jgi:hypothetical protein